MCVCVVTQQLFTLKRWHHSTAFLLCGDLLPVVASGSRSPVPNTSSLHFLMWRVITRNHVSMANNGLRTSPPHPILINWRAKAKNPFVHKYFARFSSLQVQPLASPPGGTNRGGAWRTFIYASGRIGGLGNKTNQTSSVNTEPG